MIKLASIAATAVFVFSQAQSDPIMDQDTAQTAALISTATAGTITAGEFGMLRAENQINGDVIFAKFENRHEKPLMIGSGTARR